MKHDFPRSQFLSDEAATLTLGGRLAALLTGANGFKGDAIVFLRGELGAGKTTLVRGILRALGYSGPVKSPTYTLLEPYEDQSVYHFDLYRIADSQELDFIGIDELMAANLIKLVEWPDHGLERLPQPNVQVHLSTERQGRRVDILVSD